MRLLQTVISSAGFRDVSGNRERMVLLEKLIKVSAAEDARLLVLPAGFLAAVSDNDLPSLVGQLQEFGLESRIALIGGIDVVDATAKGSRNMEDLIQTSQVPYFGFAVGQLILASDSDHPWRQTSITSNNADLVPAAAVPGPQRVAVIDGKSVAVLVCGELFSWRARQGVARTDPDLVVDIGHSGMGQGLIPAMRNLSAEGNCCVVHSQHLKDWWGRSLHFLDHRGDQLSTGASEDCLVESGSLWAAWKVRQI
jgi:hypothetical protein